MKRGVSYGKSADRRRGRSGEKNADPRDTQTTNLQVSGGSHPGVIHVPGDSMYRVTPAPSQGEMRPGGRSGGDGTVIPVTEKAVKRLAGVTFHVIDRNGQTSSERPGLLRQKMIVVCSPFDPQVKYATASDRKTGLRIQITVLPAHIPLDTQLTFTLLTTYSYHQHHRHWV